MPLGHVPFNTLSESHLLELKDGKVPESKKIDYKQETVGVSDSAVNDFLKDVTAFANTDGGYLVFGMKERAAVPIDLCGFVSANIDAEVLRLESVIRSGVRPRIFGVNIRPVSLSSGTYAIVIKIPRSWASPHMVVRGGHNRFWYRGVKGNDMMDVDQLRTAFLQAETTTELARKFRDERIDRIASRRLPPRIISDSFLAVHVIPFQAFKAGVQVNMSKAYCKWHEILPIRGAVNDSRHNAHGLVTFTTSTGTAGYPEVLSYVQLFRNGIIETVNSKVLYKDDNRNVCVAAGLIGGRVVKAVKRYLGLLGEIGAQTPVGVFISLVGCVGANIVVGHPLDTPIDEPRVLVPEIVIEDLDEGLSVALQPALDALWNAGGFANAPAFDDDGNQLSKWA